MVGGMRPIKGEERSAHMECLGREVIDEVGGSGESISPICKRHRCLEEEGASDIGGGANHALGFPVLLRGIWTRHTEGNTVGEKEIA
jgi:hypothetical protein